MNAEKDTKHISACKLFLGSRPVVYLVCKYFNYIIRCQLDFESWTFYKSDVNILKILYKSLNGVERSAVQLKLMHCNYTNTHSAHSHTIPDTATGEIGEINILITLLAAMPW